VEKKKKGIASVSLPMTKESWYREEYTTEAIP